MATKWKKRSTAIAAIAWVAICSYLHLAWPSLTALLVTLGSPSSIVWWLIRVPRVAFLTIGLLAVFGLVLKDRWLLAPLALAVDAVVAAPALAAIAVLLEPFLVPVE